MAGNKKDDGYDYTHRLAALLSELANLLVELNTMLRGDTVKRQIIPNNDTIRLAYDPHTYRAGWDAGWDACATEVLAIVGQAGQRIEEIEGS